MEVTESRPQCGVLTISDGCYHGTREDTGGPLLIRLAADIGLALHRHSVVPDEQRIISAALEELASAPAVRVILTTGGTGLAARDVTPEATLAVVDRTVPGMAEAMRNASLAKTPFAMLSRQVVGVRGHTLIINFPGSPRAVEECFAVVAPVLPHAIQLLSGHTAHG
ncbi:MAG: MogA/MoaB family molybdenum cofactor biosynthesis protein [Alicyclobacillaceae bacterium]|nr:MogA/MoaB family molybdenum cofactor biosynthesis protein [Alicyclobacillaceae bacterium]